MSANEGGADHDFDVLDQLALKSNAEIEALVSAELVMTLGRIEALLTTQSRPPITAANAVERTRELRDLKRRGSHALGTAILQASELADNGQVPEACEIYRHFIAACPSPFYRRIADYQLKKLDSR